DYTAAKISSQNDDGAGKGDLRFSTYNGTALTTRMIISNSGNVGIGSANPNMILDIADTSSAGGIRITTHNSSTVNAPINIDNFCNSAAYGAALQIRRGRGTSDVPSAILTNDVIGGIYAKGHIGTGWGTSNVAAIRMLAAEDFSATNQGTKIDFATTDTGATTRSVKMTIASNGNVGIGKTNPSRILDIEDISTIEGGATISTQNSSVTNGLLNLDNYTNSVGSGASINVSRARGTKSVPAAILSGDVIGGLWAKGHTGTGWTSGNIASIRILADEDFSATNQGSSIDFSTTNLGTTSKTVKMTINANGKVGIGTATPGYLLTVNGEPAANGYTAFTNYSDRRLKTNIKPITNVLDKIVRLNPVSFNYNEKTGYNSEHLKKKFFGFIAQELQQIFPEMVGEIELNNEKYLDSNLSSLPVYLLQAIKEQGEIIEKSKIKMEELENIVNQLKIEIEMLKKNRK
nr:tail fiber domain-containing protein [bacterium]